MSMDIARFTFSRIISTASLAKWDGLCRQKLFVIDLIWPPFTGRSSAFYFFLLLILLFLDFLLLLFSFNFISLLLFIVIPSYEVIFCFIFIFVVLFLFFFSTGSSALCDNMAWACYYLIWFALRPSCHPFASSWSRSA